MFRSRSKYSTSSLADFALDLGTSKVALYVRGEGLVLEEPACIALYGDHTSLRSLVASGELATKMIGKAPVGVRVLRPIQNGVINDSRIAGLIVAAMLSRLKMTGNFRRKKVLIGALIGANSMELKAFSEVGIFAGAGSSVTVPEPFAAAVGAGLPISGSKAQMVVDIGGGAAEAVVTSSNRIVASGSVRVGGDEMNNAITRYVFRQYRLRIANQEAQRLREYIEADPSQIEVAVRGMDLYLQRPIELMLATTELIAAIQSCLTKIVSMVVEMLTQLPVELAGDLLDSGILLTGGCAVQKNLQTYLREATQLPVNLHHSPSQAVILGAGQLIKSGSRDH